MCRWQMDGPPACFTKNAVLRILGQPRYPNSPGPPAVVAPLVAELIRHPQHPFWPDSLSLLTRAMWMHRGGRLVSFDRRLGYEGGRWRPRGPVLA